MFKSLSSNVMKERKSVQVAVVLLVWLVALFLLAAAGHAVLSGSAQPVDTKAAAIGCDERRYCMVRLLEFNDQCGVLARSTTKEWPRNGRKVECDPATVGPSL